MQRIQSFFYQKIKQDVKNQKKSILENKLSPNSGQNILNIKDLIDGITDIIHMQKTTSELMNSQKQISLVHIQDVIKEIQKKENKDPTVDMAKINNCIDQLNLLKAEFGTRFLETVSCLAKHRLSVFGSKINWFCQINETNSIENLLFKLNEQRIQLSKAVNFYQKFQNEYRYLSPTSDETLEFKGKCKELLLSMEKTYWLDLDDSEQEKFFTFLSSHFITKIIMENGGLDEFPWILEIKWTNMEFLKKILLGQFGLFQPGICKKLKLDNADNEFKLFSSLRMTLTSYSGNSQKRQFEEHLKNVLNKIEWSSEAQIKIFDSMLSYHHEGRDKLHKKVLLTENERVFILQMMRKCKFALNPERQEKLAKRIFNNELGDISTAIEACKGVINWKNEEIQMIMRPFILKYKESKETPTAADLVLFEILGIQKQLFESEDFQYRLAIAIWSDVRNVEEIFKDILWTNPKAERIICNKINLMSTSAKRFNMVVKINSPTVKSEFFTDAIDGKFKYSAEILLQCLDIIEWAQEKQEAIKKISQNLQKASWDDQDAQKKIAIAIVNSKFGTDQEVIENLVKFIKKVKWSDAWAVQCLQLAIVKNKLGKVDLEFKKMIDDKIEILIRQNHFLLPNEDFSKHDPITKLNYCYAYLICDERCTIEELGKMLELQTQNDAVLCGYKQALEKFKLEFQTQGLGNDEEESAKERILLYKNPLDDKFYFLSITGDLLNQLEAVVYHQDGCRVLPKGIFKPNFVEQMSNKTISLYSLDEKDKLIQFQVENKGHKTHFPIFMQSVIDEYHKRIESTFKQKLQDLILKKLMLDNMTKSQQTEIQEIFSSAFSNLNISSASMNVNLKKRYESMLLKEFAENGKLIENIKHIAAEVARLCQTCGQQEQYLNMLLFSAFMFGRLSSASVLGWHTGGDNGSNQILRAISLELFNELKRSIRQQTGPIFLGDKIVFLENVMAKMESTRGAKGSEGIGFCIGLIMQDILDDKDLKKRIEFFFTK